MSVPEIRWCEHSGMVLRCCNDGTFVVLDVVGEADDVSVLASIRLLLPEVLRREAEEIAARWTVELDWKRHRAARRRYRIRTVLALAVGVALGAPLGRWSR